MKITVRKLIAAVLILLVLIAVVSVILVSMNIIETQKQTEFRNSMISKSAVQAIKLLETEINRTYDNAVKKTESEVDMMVKILQPYVIGSRYEGPSIFDDGVVVQLKDGNIYYPTDFPYNFMLLDADVLQRQPPLTFFSMIKEDGSESISVWITAKNIKNDFWYIDWTSEDDYKDVLERQQEIFDTIEDLQESFDGYLFLFERNDPDLKTYYTPPEFSYVTCAGDIGIKKEYIESNYPMVSVNDKGYFAGYATLRLFSTPITAVFLIRMYEKMFVIVNNITILMTLTMISILAVILWIYWVRTYVTNNELSEMQKNDYHPSHIRRITRSVGLIGMIVIFVIALFLDLLGNLSLNSSNNNKLLDLINDRMDDSNGFISYYRDDVESWNLYYAEKLASLYVLNPEMLTQEFLAEANKLIESEYIVLFDENGHEIIASNGLIDLDMASDLSENGSILNKLLKGVTRIVLDPEEDKTLGIETQLIGVPVYNPEEKNYGALVISIDPEKSWKQEEKKEFSGFLKLITPSGNASFVVDKESGSIIYSNNDSYVGKRAADIGLYYNEVPDTELDVFNIIEDFAPSLYYGAYQQDDMYQYYYMTFSDVLRHNTFPNTLISAAGYLLIFWIVTTFMLHSYKNQAYNEMVNVSKSAADNYLLDEEVNMEWLRMQNDDDDQESLRDKWKKLFPERKTAVFIQVCFSLIIITGAIRLLNPNVDSTGSVIGFILRGAWRRGINLLSLAGILILILCFTILLMFKNLLLSLVSNYLDSKAKTVFRLVFSLIQYAAIIALLFFSFGFLGFDTRALLASVSLLSLAVSLGAKDLVADILAGIFIIFEDDFHVGDIIDVNGFSGIVQEIGVRSTKLIGIGDNVKIIGNQNVKNVLNMSKMNSWYSIDLKVSADQPILEIEEMLKRELPAVGEAIPEIISGPYYKGIMAIGGIYTLYIIAECKQVNFRRVQRELNHAVILLFDKYGYKLI